MKKISVLEIATVFTGSFLGAGFLSGQELLQFFGVFGGYGLAGMVLAIAAFCLFSLLVMDYHLEVIDTTAKKHTEVPVFQPLP